jgi:hypothetical protein
MKGKLGCKLAVLPEKGKVYPCRGNEALYRPYGKVHPCTGTEALYKSISGVEL